MVTLRQYSSDRGMFTLGRQDSNARRMFLQEKLNTKSHNMHMVLKSCWKALYDRATTD